MRLMKMMIIVALAIATMVAPLALAKDYVVGDDNGWKLDFDYQDWSKGKSFQVGDNLIFKYKKGAHNVIKVNGDGFKECSQSENSGVLASGNDEITLSSPGRKWYICGVGNHCESGMKLLITVQSEASSDSSSISPPQIAPTLLASIISVFSIFIFMLI